MGGGRLAIFAKEGDQTLGKSVREDEFGTDDQDLGLSKLAPPHRYQLTLGVKPLKNAPTPSVLTISLMMVIPPTCELKLAFWIRVLTTSNGEATVMEATAPAIEATKSASQLLNRML